MLREVSGYNPQEHMIQITDPDGKSRAYLEVCHRKDWFLRYCEEHGVSGLLDDSEVKIDRESKLVIVTAKVFMDNKLIGISSAAKVYDPAYAQPNDTPVQNAGTIALGRALANAGFGTTASYSPGEDSDILADAPVRVPSDPEPTAENNPLIAAIEGNAPKNMTTAQSAAAAILGQAQKNRTPQQTKPSPQPDPVSEENASAGGDSARGDQPTEVEADIPPVHSKSEAYAAVIPVGVMKGRTIGEVLNTQRGGKAILFALRKKEYASRFPELANAIAIALDVKAG